MVDERSNPLGITVQLVESENRPMGVTLVNPNKVNKASDPMDLVELARQVQKVIFIYILSPLYSL